MYSAVITQSGQVTLPKELREFLGVKPGERVIFNIDKKSVTIKTKPTMEEFFAELDAIHKKYNSKGQSTPDAVEAVRAFREGKCEAFNAKLREEYL